MRTIYVKPVEIIGNCRANLTLDDEFRIKGMKLENPRQSNLCFLALGHFPSIVSQLQQDNHFYAHVICPECLSHLGVENSVTFLLGHADKWELCQAISEYHRLWKQRPESEIAGQLREEAAQHQKQGDYTEATQKMKAALVELKQLPE
jgi:hypothetical protein